MDSRSFWKALAVQGLALAAVAGLLIALPLGDDFFDDWGYLTGPAAWIVCSLVSARILAVPTSIALFSALAGGVAGTLVFLVTSHTPGVIAGLLVFAASCASYEDTTEGE